MKSDDKNMCVPHLDDVLLVVLPHLDDVLLVVFSRHTNDSLWMPIFKIFGFVQAATHVVGK